MFLQRLLLIAVESFLFVLGLPWANRKQKEDIVFLVCGAPGFIKATGDNIFVGSILVFVAVH